MKVKKRSGKTENFNDEKIKICAERTCAGIDDVSATELVYNSTIKLDTNVEYFVS